MSYSDLYLQQSRPKVSPILVAIVLMVVIGAASFFVFSSSTPTRASKKTVKRLEIVNVTAHQVGIVWESESADKSWILYGDSPGSVRTIARDDRDLTELTDRVYHYVTIKNLNPDSTYYFKIISNNEVIAAAGGEPFQVKTILENTITSSLRPAYGKVVLPNGTPAMQTLVLLKYKNAFPLVAMTGSTGEWLIPLQSVVNKDTYQVTTISDKEKVEIEVIGEDMKSNIQSLVTRLNPIPQTIILGKDYTFLEEEQVLPASTKREVTLTQKEYPVAIRFPQENAVIPASQPLIRGSGIPGKTVMVTINSVPQFSTSVEVDDKGDWYVSIPITLRAGNYTLMMTSTDINGKTIGLRRKFVIAKSGEQVLGDATGSASLTPTKSPTPSSLLSLTPTSTLSASISATITLMPTSTPIVLGSDITATPAPPTSGMSVLPYIFTAIGMVVIGAGFVLLF